ncbi:MAG: V-type ATP synthase subunit E [Clostridia bacterium]|nr:V-type ATP synthase subunit E [Clostridia bacterium]
MAINGLNKITDKILSEAQAKADKILADAQAECDRINAEYAERAEKIRSDISTEAEKGGMEYVARIRSTAATSKRNLLLQTKSDLIDGVFAGVMEQTRTMELEKYNEILIGLLSAAILEQLESEEISRTLYGEEEALAPEAYEVIFNQRDRDRSGKTVVEGTKAHLSGKVSGEKLARLTLSQQTANIEGGLILRCGSVESNCSLSILFAQLRESLESEVARTLFEART